ncbi:5-hydroxytryptamine receptor 3A-like [Bufo gargarizans]|uniref:5-hydroxytryptamine receptor 3A-like n=1 Tax=Bufo gargarizans TaxID=30331 RepID=UPI001CF3B282|nr:5-hydroxytryptamine receptor 3A-like [Bufo gargarizans]
MQRVLLLMLLLCAVTCGQDICGYYNVTDSIGVLEQSPRLMNIRPVKDWREPTIVSVDMTFRAVLDMDEKLQIMTTLMDLEVIWENQFLSWDPEKFCGITRILIPEGSVWIPDISIAEITEDDSLVVVYMQLYYNGTIRRTKTLKVVTTCPLDLYKFPFDTQKCNLTFGISDILLVPSSSAQQVTLLSIKEFAKAEWSLKEVNIIHLNISKFGEEWSKVIYQVLIRRAPILYVINLIIPACLLVIVDAASMFIPMEGGERLGFKITVVLGFSVLLLILNDFLPNTDNPPILGVFCMVCLLIMIVSIIDSIFISYMLYLSAVKPEVPQWLKLWVLKRLAFVLRISIQDEFPDPTTIAVKNKAADELPALHDSETETNRRLAKDSKDSPEIKLLKRLLLELLMVRRHLIVSKKEEAAKSEWNLVAFVLDRFILILYLFIVIIIVVIVVLVWAI